MNDFLINFYTFLLTASAMILNKAEPSFVSRPETFKFVAGDTITLPCDVANAGECFGGVLIELFREPLF